MPWSLFSLCRSTLVLTTVTSVVCERQNIFFCQNCRCRDDHTVRMQSHEDANECTCSQHLVHVGGTERCLSSRAWWFPGRQRCNLVPQKQRACSYLSLKFLLLVFAEFCPPMWRWERWLPKSDRTEPEGLLQLSVSWLEECTPSTCIQKTFSVMHQPWFCFP